MQASDLEYEESLLAELEEIDESNNDSQQSRVLPSLKELCSRAFIPIATVEVMKTFPYELVECIQHYIDDYQLQKTLCGSIKAWHPNGNLKTFGMFDEEGEKHGEWKAWHASGQLKEVTGYLHGQPDGLEAGWFKDGCRRFKSKRDNCVLHGSLKVWDRSGQLLQHWRYKEGQKHGEWRSWWPNGKPMREENWDMGQKHGVFKRWGEIKPGWNSTEHKFEVYDQGKLISAEKQRVSSTGTILESSSAPLRQPRGKGAREKFQKKREEVKKKKRNEKAKNRDRDIKKEKNS